MTTDRAQPPISSPSTIDVLVDEIRVLRNLVERMSDKLNGSLKPFFTVSEVAGLTGRSEFTVRRWITVGRLRAERIAGTGPHGKLLIPRAELARLIDSGHGEKMSGLETLSMPEVASND